MKKLLLAAALLFASFGAFAEDDVFDNFVEGMRKELAPQGMKVTSDKAKRIVTIELKLPADVKAISQEEAAMIKKELIGELTKNSDVAAVLQALKITMIYNFVLVDGATVKVKVTPADLEKAAGEKARK